MKPGGTNATAALRGAALLAALALAGCVSPPSPAPGAAADAVTLLLRVQVVMVDGALPPLVQEAQPLAHAALLAMQQHLRAAGGAGTARFILRGAEWSEESSVGGDPATPVLRQEGRLRYAVDLRGTTPPPAPVEGEARSVLLMVGHASPAEAAWARQQIAHEAVERMTRNLAGQLAPWRAEP